MFVGFELLTVLGLYVVLRKRLTRSPGFIALQSLVPWPPPRTLLDRVDGLAWFSALPFFPSQEKKRTRKKVCLIATTVVLVARFSPTFRDVWQAKSTSSPRATVSVPQFRFKMVERSPSSSSLLCPSDVNGQVKGVRWHRHYFWYSLQTLLYMLGVRSCDMRSIVECCLFCSRRGHEVSKEFCFFT